MVFRHERSGVTWVDLEQPTPEELGAAMREFAISPRIESELARRAVSVLDDDVNPSIASHGGRADLVAMDDANKVAYICQTE